MPHMQPGTVLADRYRLESILGKGGMGAVWRAHHLTLNVPLAIKFIDPELAQGADMMARFTREAQAAAALQGCPNVVQTIDHGVHDGVAFIAMELMKGEDLGSRLHRLGSLSPSATARILGQAGRAITRAHAAGIIHRDLKPDNIFLAQDGDDEIAKVLDFGIAKLLADSTYPGQPTRAGAVLGTPFYMSPEQAEGSALDHRTDVWALGVVACECLTGKRAFDGETLTELVLTICTRPMPVPSTLGSVPPGFDAWFARSCARDLDLRYTSVRSQLRDLGEICGVLLVDSARDADAARDADSEFREVTYRSRRATTAPVVTPGHGELYSGASHRARKYTALSALALVLAGAGWLVFSRTTNPSQEYEPVNAGGITPTDGTRVEKHEQSSSSPALSVPVLGRPESVSTASAAVEASRSADTTTALTSESASIGVTQKARVGKSPKAVKANRGSGVDSSGNSPSRPQPSPPRVEETDYGF